jgi:hypothetical protein
MLVGHRERGCIDEVFFNNQIKQGTMAKVWKERINYSVTRSGTIVAQSVNFPCVVEGADLEEVKKRMKHLIECFIDQSTEMVRQDDPFDFKEEIIPEELTEQEIKK